MLAHGSRIRAPAGDDDGYYRAVLVRWYGVPLELDIPTPVYPPHLFASSLISKVYALIPTAEAWNSLLSEARVAG